MSNLRDTIHTLASFGKTTKPKTPGTTSPEPTPPPTPKVKEIDLTPPAGLEAELLACLTEPTADNTTRMNITIPESLKKRFHTRCAQDGHTMSGLVNLWIQKYLTMSLVLFGLSVSLMAAEKSTYSTTEILSFVDKPNALPDLTVGTKARTGYGIGETMEGSELQPDLYAGLYARFDFISTAEIRKRKETGRTEKAEVLHNLSQILGHEQMLTFLNSQKSNYLSRKKIMEERIERGFSEQGDIIPIEQHLITIETRIHETRALVRDSQLEIAALSGEKWKELFTIVQKWDRKL